jgi:hypothetical protein
MNSSDRLERGEGMINEMVFLSMKYARLMNDIEIYQRLKRDFATSSFVGDHHEDRLLDDALQEQKRVSNQLEDIKKDINGCRLCG